MDVSGVSQSSAQAAPSTYFQQRAVDLVKLGQALESGDLSGAQDAYNSLQTLAQSSPFESAAAFGFTRRQQEFNVLGNDLQAGNLAAAQRVFSELRHNRAVDPANADGSDWPGPAAIVELSIQVTTAPPPSTPAPTDSSTPVDANASGSTPPDQPASGSPAPSSASTPSPLPEIVINVAPETGSSPVTIDINLPSAPAASPSSSTGSAGASTTANTAPGAEIVVNVGNSSSGPEQITLGLAANANGGEQVTLGIGSPQNPNQEQLIINLAQNSNEQIILNLLNATSAGTTAPTNGALISINV